MNYEMLPCPACGNNNIRIYTPLKCARCFAYCDNIKCTVMGPNSGDKQSAINAWNALPRALEWSSGQPNPSAWNWWSNGECQIPRYVYADMSIDKISGHKMHYSEIGGKWCAIPEPKG